MEAQSDHLLELDGMGRTEPAAMQAKAAPASASASWCELILGRTTGPKIDRPWDPTLLRAMYVKYQRKSQTFQLQSNSTAVQQVVERYHQRLLSTIQRRAPE
jgi:hypothetical protein